MPRTQIHPIIAPLRGLRKNLPADLIDDLEMSGCKNVFLEDGLVKKRFGYPKKGNNLPLAGAVIGSDQFYDFAGNNWLLVLTTKLAYEWLPNDNCWNPINDSEVEDDCETTWTDPGDNVAVADDAVDYKVGSKSQKITLDEAFSTGLAAYRDQSLGDKSAYSFIRLWIKSSVATVAGDLRFLIDDTAGCGSPKENLLIPALLADTWTVVTLEASAPATKMNSIESLGIYVQVDNGAQIVRIDDIQFVKSFSSSVTDSDLCSHEHMRKRTEENPWWVFTNGVDAIQKWTGTGDIGVLNIEAPIAKSLVEFKDHLLLLDVTEGGYRYPQRIRWSDTGDPEEWDSGNASYVDLSGSDWIQGAKKFKGDYIAILKERSVWVGYPTGDSDVFEFALKAPETGCAAGKTIEVYENDVIFLAWDDVYKFNGIDCTPIATPVRREIIDSINPEQIHRCFALTLEEQKEYWLFVPTSGNTYCDTAWCYNLELESWTKHTFADFITMYGFYERQAAVTFNELPASFDDQDRRYDDRTILASTPTTLFGDKDGYVYEYLDTAHNDDGVTVDGYFETKDYNLTKLISRQRILRLDVCFVGTGLDVYYSIDKGKTWKKIKSLGSSSSFDRQKLSFRNDSDWIRFRFRNNASNGWFHFSRGVIHWQRGGRIV